MQHGAPGPDREGQAEPSASQQLGRLGAHGLRGLRHLGRRVDVGLALEQQPRHLLVTVLSRQDQGGAAVLRAWTIRWSRAHVLCTLQETLPRPARALAMQGAGDASACGAGLGEEGSGVLKNQERRQGKREGDRKIDR